MGSATGFSPSRFVHELDSIEAAMSVLTRFPHEDDEISIAPDAHGLRAWVPLGVMVPIKVATEALEGFFETQGALSLDGWAWESVAQAQAWRFS